MSNKKTQVELLIEKLSKEDLKSVKDFVSSKLNEREIKDKQKKLEIQKKADERFWSVISKAQKNKFKSRIRKLHDKNFEQVFLLKISTNIIFDCFNYWFKLGESAYNLEDKMWEKFEQQLYTLKYTPAEKIKIDLKKIFGKKAKIALRKLIKEIEEENLSISDIIQ